MPSSILADIGGDERDEQINLPTEKSIMILRKGVIEGNLNICGILMQGQPVIHAREDTCAFRLSCAHGPGYWWPACAFCVSGAHGPSVRAQIKPAPCLDRPETVIGALGCARVCTEVFCQDFSALISGD